MRMRTRIYFLAILTVTGPTCKKREDDKPSRPTSMQPATSLGLNSMERYSGCEDMSNDLLASLRSQLEVAWKSAQYQRDFPSNFAKSASADTGNSDSPSVQSAQPSEVSTNVQVKGVDESDDIKMNSRSIFIVDNQLNTSGVIISVVAKAPLASLDTITIPGMTGAQLYTIGDRLVVSGTKLGWPSQFMIQVYDVQGKPVLKSEFSMPSQPVASRMIGSKFFAVLNEPLRKKKNLPYPTLQDLRGSFEKFTAGIRVEDYYDVQENSIAGINCNKMMKLPVVGAEYQVQRVLTYDIDKGEVLDEAAIPGGPSGIYMSNQNLYTYGHPMLRDVWVDPMDSATLRVYWEQMQQVASNLIIKKISFDPDTGKLTPQAIGVVPGHLKSFDGQWAFNELQKDGETFLSVVTTTGDVRSEGAGAASNHLFILRQAADQLTEAASIKDFGQNEDVRSVRYIGTLAYVVTFKRTDPLFTIDLADPLAPKIVGELKIPGFSLYMHPHAGNRLLGVGYQTEESGETDINRAFFQGILFQLFDTTDPAASTRLDFVELGKRGSYSEANQDHHAFYYDAPNGLAALPVVLFDNGTQDVLNGQKNHTTRSFSGAIFFRIQDQKLAEAARISHADLMGPNCLAGLQPLTWTSPIVANPEVRRIFRDGDTIYTISNFGVKTLNATTLMSQGQVGLNRPDCFVRQTNGGFE